VLSAHAPDRIKSLPGWTGDLPSKQFSGYLNGSNTTRLHYWFVEAEKSPATAATVLWFNGGPGCSSLDGFFYEHGPFEVDRSDYTKLVEREFRWNTLVNMLYIEAPVGVGFSYSIDRDYKCDDDRTATENRAAVEDFFSKFPEYKENQFWITGESYAGVYVPTLAEAILHGEKDGTYTGAKLNGIAVGNGCSGTEVGICGDGPQGTYYEWQYLLNTGFIDQNLKDSVNKACDWEAASANEKNALSAKCVSLLNAASAEIAHVNMYNIYGDCVSSSCPSGDSVLRGKVPQSKQITVMDMLQQHTLNSRITPHGPDACIDSAAASGYLNQPEVWDALHVQDPGFCWSVCGSAKGWSYTSTRTNLPANTYPELVGDMRVVIFNGDWDACVPYTDGQAWTDGMGFETAKSWHAWTYTSTLGNENQVAGYATKYDVSGVGSGTGSFEFITVKGGRHEVPETAPGQALELVNRLLSGTEF